MSKLLSRLLLISLVATNLVSSPVQAAPNAVVTGTTDKSSYTVGETVTLTVNANVSEFTATAIESRTNYDNAKLEYLSDSSDGSTFPSEITSSGSNGSSRFTARWGTGTTGNSRVVRYTFRATSAGTATFSYTDLKIVEGESGQFKSVSGTNNSITISNASTPTPTATATATTKPTTKPTAKPTATPTTKPTATPTPTPTTTATTGTGISASQSTVTISKDSAIADGIDYITLCVVVKRADGTVVTDIEPTVTGLREESDTNTAFISNSTDQTWCSDFSSTAEGLVSVTISAGNVVLATKDLTYTAAPTEEPTTIADVSDSSSDGSTPFWLILLIGFFILLLILLLLWWLYKRLKEHRDEDAELENLDDGTGEAYPGDESVTEESSPVAAGKDEQQTETPPASPTAESPAQ